MILIVDRIIDNYAVCENQDTKKMVEINLEILPKNIHDGSVLKYDNGKYIIDENSEDERRKSILEKFNRLKG